MELGDSAGQVVNIPVGFVGGDELAGFGSETSDVAETEAQIAGDKIASGTRELTEGGGVGIVRVIGASHQRSRLDVREAHFGARAPVVVELRRWNVAHDR